MRGKKIIAGGGDSARQAALCLARSANQVASWCGRRRWPPGCVTTSSARSTRRPITSSSAPACRSPTAPRRHLHSLVWRTPPPGRGDRPSDALFVLVGARPRTECSARPSPRPAGSILTGPDLPAAAHPRASRRPPLPLETSLPGVFAAGDVRRGSVKRVASRGRRRRGRRPPGAPLPGTSRRGPGNPHRPARRRGSPPARHRHPAAGLATVPTPAEPAMLATPTR